MNAAILFTVLIGLAFALPYPAKARMVTYDRVIHVAQSAAASDENPGTEEAPFETLGRALEAAAALNREGLSVWVVVGAGTYRESLAIEAEAGATDAALMLEAEEASAVTVSGSIVVNDGNRRWTGEGSVYSLSWPAKFISDSPSGWPEMKEIVRRREMVFVDGAPYRQVLARSELKPGAFLADGDRLYVRFPQEPAEDLSDRTIEVALKTELLRIDGRRNVSIKGIVFQHATNPLARAAVVVSNSAHVLFEDCVLQWNNWDGLQIERSEDVTLRRVQANHNGGSGFGGYRNENVSIEESEASYNNWRGGMGGFFGWDPGQKFLSTRGLTIRGYKAVGNEARGLWLDYDNRDVVIEDALFEGNIYGIFIEANEGPITVRRSRFIDNSRVGIEIAETVNLLIEDVELRNNGTRAGDAQLLIAGDPDSVRDVKDWQTGAVHRLTVEDMTLRDCVISGEDPKTQLLVSTYLGEELWRRFADSLTSENNRWRHAGGADVFEIFRERRVDFSGWREITGQDRDSVWEPL